MTKKSYEEQVRKLTPHQAREEAARCLLCADAPCANACPAGVDVMHFIRAILFHNERRALDVIREANVLAGVCGTICPHESLCEGACNREKLTEPIRIGALQRYAADCEARFGRTWRPERTMNGHRAAVIGGGPGGLAAAAAFARAGVAVTVFEKRNRAGGMVNYGVPRFRLADEVVDREVDFVRSLGVDLRLDEPVYDVRSLLAQGFEAVVVAVGLGAPDPRRIPGDEARGFHRGLSFIEELNKDLDNAAERMQVGKNVVILGGGQVAMDLAEHALRLGAVNVECVSRRSPRDLRAGAPAEFELALRHGVGFTTLARVSEIETENNQVVAVKGLKARWKEPDRFDSDNLEVVPGTDFRILADTVLQAAGQVPEPDDLPLLEAFETDRKGRIVTKTEAGLTSLERVWAAGDIRSGGGGTIVRSVAEGREAARAAITTLGLTEKGGAA